MTDKRIILSVCINDSRNGMPTGRLRAVDFLECRLGGALCSEYNRWHPACHIEFGADRKQLVIGQRSYPVHGHITWYGNWCWDAVAVDLPTLQQIVEHLHSLKKFDVDEAPTEFFHAWEDGQGLREAVASRLPT